MVMAASASMRPTKAIPAGGSEREYLTDRVAWSSSRPHTPALAYSAVNTSAITAVAPGADAGEESARARRITTVPAIIATPPWTTDSDRGSVDGFARRRGVLFVGSHVAGAGRLAATIKPSAPPAPIARGVPLPWGSVTRAKTHAAALPRWKIAGLRASRRSLTTYGVSIASPLESIPPPPPNGDARGWLLWHERLDERY